jgi:hypothetical protein
MDSHGAFPTSAGSPATRRGPTHQGRELPGRGGPAGFAATSGSRLSGRNLILRRQPICCGLRRAQEVVAAEWHAAPLIGF